MRILFLDSNEKLMHLLPNGFRDAGHDVMVETIQSKSGIHDRIASLQPDLVVTQGWGMEQIEKRQTWLRQAVQRAGVPHVYWSVEDPAFTDSFVLPLIRRMQPDYVFTICPEAVTRFRNLGIRSHHLDWGYQPTIHCRVERERRYRVNVAVVANSYAWLRDASYVDYRFMSMRRLIKPLLKNGIRVDFWGNGWDSASTLLGYDVPSSWIHGELPYLEANKVYSAARIVIGLQNFKTQVTQRTYEILGTGGFLLTSDTPAVRNLFRPGHDLVVSKSSSETVKLVRYYLRHRRARRKIRVQGHESVRSEKYRHRAETMIRVLREEGVLRD